MAVDRQHKHTQSCNINMPSIHYRTFTTYEGILKFENCFEMNKHDSSCLQCNTSVVEVDIVCSCGRHQHQHHQRQVDDVRIKASNATRHIQIIFLFVKKCETKESIQRQQRPYARFL